MNEIDENLKQLFNSARQIQLNTQDKLTLREKLVSHIQMMPIRSPYIFSIQTFVMSRVAVLAVAIIMIGSGALSHASTGALPGERLYPFKIGVTEPMEEILILSEKSKAKYEVKLVSRRLQEATLLARAGKLDQATSIELEEGIKEHVESASTHAKEMAKNQDGAGAKEVTAQLEGSLAQHSASLTVIADAESDTKVNTVVPLLAAVKEQVQVAKETTARVEVEIASQQDETTLLDNEDDIFIDANTDFEDSEALDDINIDYLDGEPTYKDELFITDGQVVPNTIDAPKVPNQEVKGETVSKPILPTTTVQIQH